MELSSADYEEAFHYSPKRNYTGAIYEYCQRQNTLPSFALIPGPIGGERLFTVQLHLNGLRTIGLARTVKAARHRASENMVRRIGFRAYTFVKNFWIKICLKHSFSCVCVLVTGSYHVSCQKHRWENWFVQAIFKTYNRCLFKSTTGASFTLFSNIYSCGGRYLHVFHIIRFTGVICVGLSSLPPPGSQHTPVFRYLRQTCLVSAKQSSLSFHTLVPKVLEVHYQTTTISNHLLVSNWVKAFFNFRYGEPSWRSNNAHAILRCQGNTIIHTVHVMNACAPRSLTSCNERINDKHTILVETPARLDRTPFTHMRDSGYVLMLFIDTVVVTQRCRHLDAAFKLGGI